MEGDGWGETRRRSREVDGKVVGVVRSKKVAPPSKSLSLSLHRIHWLHYAPSRVLRGGKTDT